MAFTLFTSLCISLLYRQSVLGVTVHFSSPGGHHGLAGVYRAVVDVDALLGSPQSEASEMGTDFSCLNLGSGSFLTGLSVRSLSYDAAVGRTVVQIGQHQAVHSTVISDKTCTPEKSCGEYGPEFTKIMKNQPTKDEGFINPLASWNDSLYFVYTPDTEHVYYFGYRPYLQLRRFNDGYSFPTAHYPDAIEVDSFSTLIANISVSGRWLQAGGFLIVLSRGEGKDLMFMTVARAVVYPKVESEGTQFSYVLVAIHGEVAKVLHITTDTTQGWYGHIIQSEGGVSYKDGMLCWTVADRILCGAWSPDQPLTPPPDVEAVLMPGQAAKVCKFSTGLGSIYGNVTTGVVLVETPEKDGRLALFFGCFSTVMTKGGLGLLVKEPSKAQVGIIQVRYDNKTILAGTMFVTPDDLCAETENVIMINTTETVSAAGRLIYAVKILLVCLTSIMLLI